MTALPPLDDPWALATLDALAGHYARRHGDTPAVTAARRAALRADLDQHQARRGAAYRNPQAHTARSTEGAAA